MAATQKQGNAQQQTEVPRATSALRSFVHLLSAETESNPLVRIEGWVFSDAGEQIHEVRALARGKTWPALYAIPRPDVAAVFPSANQSGESGFSVEITGRPGSSFKVQLEAKREAADWETFFQTDVAIPASASWIAWLRTSLGKRPARDAGSQHPSFLLCVDEPRDWAKVPRRFRLSGWCFSRSGVPIEAIRARVDRHEYAGTYGVFRADVAALYREKAGTFKSGFDLLVEAPRGRATLKLDVRVADGTWIEIFSKRISAPFINLRPVPNAQLWEIGDYAAWIKRYDTLRLRDRREISSHIDTLAARPLISVVMSVYNPAIEDLRRAIDSVRAQLYRNWELCIVDDASTARDVHRILARYEKRDDRIKVRFRERNGGIAVASNEALALTGGEFIALLDHDDELAPAALYFVACEINDHPDAQLIYSDEDKLDITGRRSNAHFKPDWNRQLFLAQNFFSHLGVFKAELIKELAFRAGFEGSQDYDLVLRCCEKIDPCQIRHIPRILYHWRMTAQSAALNLHAKPHARAAAIKAVEEHLARGKIEAAVLSSGDEDFRRVRYALPNELPRVSIIIPTRDLVELLQPCVKSILQETSYPNFELVVIDNGSREAATLRFLDAIATDSRVRVLQRDEEFHYGRLNNFGVRSVESEFVGLLNNDLTIIQGDWLREMVSQAVQPGVAAVGARLLYPDGRIQHAGVILGGGGIAAHAHKGLPRANHGYFARAILVQELSAVTAACLLVRRSLYLEVGGFDEEHLQVAFNDVDFCLRLRQRGYRIIYTPYAELYHSESASRGLEDTVVKDRRFQAEIKYMHDKWGATLQSDPAYNQNLSLVSADFTLAFPPRLTNPWQQN